MSPYHRQHPVCTPRSARSLRPHPLTVALACALAAGLPASLSQAQTLPAGASVVSGQAAIVTQGNQMTISNSRNALLNWQSFSIGAGQSVRFEQPDASSQVLNRVLGRDPSLISGRLSSNGSVWLLNPYGVVFGAGARIDVAGLVASTLNINDADWQARRYGLVGGNSLAEVVNQGEIRTTQGGHVLLLGGAGGVRNEGLIEAPGGQLMLAAGSSVDLADSASPQLAVRVTAPAGAAVNLGRMLAAGGRIDLQAAMVNQQGIVRADNLSAGPGGEVRLEATSALTLGAGSQTSADGASGGRIQAQGRTTLVEGAVSADGRQGLGGAVRLLGQDVGLLAGSAVSASGQAGGGEVLVGGGLQGKDPSVPNARAVYMDAAASVRADAGAQGDGGRIVLWSDQATRAYGTLSARGGARSGDGGFIETSGGWLDARPRSVRADAAQGRPGLWLLDPNDILIAADVSDAGVTGDPVFTTTGDSATVSMSTIASALNAGNSVSVTTSSGGSSLQSGNITFRGLLSVSPPSTTSFTLNAARNIDFEQDTDPYGGTGITATGSPLNVTLNAGTAGAGAVRIASSNIDINGSLTIGGPSTACGTAGCAPFAAAVGNSDAGHAFGVSIESSSLRAGRISIRGASAADETTHGGIDIDSGSVLSANRIDLSGWTGSDGNFDQYGVRAAGVLEARDQLSIDGTSRLNGSGSQGGTARGVSLEPFSSVLVGPTALSEGRVGLFGGFSAAHTDRRPLAADPNRFLQITGSSDPSSFMSSESVFFGSAFSSVTDKAGISIRGDGGTLLMANSFFDTSRAGNLLIGGDSPLVVDGGFIELPTGEPVRITNTQGVTFATPLGGLPSQMTIDAAAGDVSFVQCPGECSTSLDIGSAPLTVRANGFLFGDDGSFVDIIAGPVLIQASTIILGSNARISSDAAGNAITFAGLSGNAATFLAAGGSGVLDAPKGRWLVYATDPLDGANFSSGGLVHDFTQYAATFGFVGPAGTGNGLLFSLAPQLSPSGRPTSPVTKVYDGTTVAPVDPSGLTLGGLMPGDVVVGNVGFGNFQYADRNVGTAIPIRASLTGAGIGLAIVDAAGRPVFGYTYDSSGALFGDITPRPLSVATVSALDKVYDGTRSVTLQGSGFTGLVGLETLSLVPLGAQFDTKDVGQGKIVSGSFALADGPDGSLARNYQLSGGGVVQTTASITPRLLSLGSLSFSDKVYDGTVAAQVTGGGLQGLVAGESLNVVTTSAAFDTKDAATNKLVTATVALADGAGGGLGSNYRLDQASLSGRASILPKPLTVGGLQAADKVYDGTTAASISGGALSGLVGTETLNFATIGTFDSKDAGTGKRVTVALTLSDGAQGGLAANYLLDNLGSELSARASITPRPLSASGLAVATRVYDGTRLAQLAPGATLDGLVAGEDLLVQLVGGLFDTPNAGSNKPVTGSLQVVDGARGRSANYQLAGTANPTLSGTITPRPLTVASASAADKVYDGSADASVTIGSLQGLVAGESLTAFGSGLFDNPRAGSDKPVSISVTLADGPGGLAANYTTVGSGLAARASITPRPVSVSGVSALDKEYDGTLAAALSAATFTGLVPGETLGLSSQALFLDKNVGQAKAVSGSFGLADGSGRATDYTLTNPGSFSGTAAILPRGLRVIGAVASDKVYDATVAAAVSGFRLDGVVGSEQVSVAAGSGAFADANVGVDKPVAATALTLGGADAGNYALAQATVTTRASISPAQLIYVADPRTAAQGNPLPNLTGTVTGFLGADALGSATTGLLTFTTTATPTSPEGSYPVIGGGLSARNYLFAQAPGNDTALTLAKLSTSQLGELGSTTPTVPQTINLVLPLPVVSSPTSHRALDAASVMQAGQSGLSFRVLDLANVPSDELAGTLAARDRYKKTIFADAIRELEANPAAADVEACQTVEQAAAGNCLITEALMPALRARLQIEQQAPAPVVAVSPPAPTTPARPEVVAPVAPSPVTQPAPAPLPTPTPLPALAAPAPAPAVVAQARVETPLRLPPLRSVKTAALPQIQRKWALLIGTDVYRDTKIPQLDNAVADVEAVAGVLEDKLGYQTLMVRNGSKAAILRAFNELAAAVSPSDSVAIYYAGHGELVEKIGLGFWQPSDADASRPETWISNTDIGKLLGQLGASQVVLVSDSCFSGSLVSDERIRAGGAVPDAASLLSRRAAVVMSSGGNEPVFDSGKNGHSTFAWSFMRAIEKVATWRPGSNVFEQVRFAVAREIPQRPQYGASRLGGHESGADYVFEQRQLDTLSK
jgi:filamentous hemagglutinin family protein